MAIEFRIPRDKQDQTKPPLYGLDGKQQRQSTLEEICEWMRMASEHSRTGVLHRIENGQILTLDAKSGKTL